MAVDFSIGSHFFCSLNTMIGAYCVYVLPGITL
jgi:hypothetical protein